MDNGTVLFNQRSSFEYVGLLLWISRTVPFQQFHFMSLCILNQTPGLWRRQSNISLCRVALFVVLVSKYSIQSNDHDMNAATSSYIIIISYLVTLAAQHTPCWIANLTSPYTQCLCPFPTLHGFCHPLINSKMPLKICLTFININNTLF